MNSLYWLIVGGLAAVGLLVLAVAVADVLRTAGSGRVRPIPRSSRSGNGPTDAPPVLPPEAVQRFNDEAYTQPLYRRDRRWDRGSEP
jgi:hypothetical protein